MMAQVDLLKDRGHPYRRSPTNRSSRRSTRSIPTWTTGASSYMVDNCSTTARLGARKWAPRFDYILKQQAFPAIDQNAVKDDTPFDKFLAATSTRC